MWNLKKKSWPCIFGMCFDIDNYIVHQLRQYFKSEISCLQPKQYFWFLWKNTKNSLTNKIIESWFCIGLFFWNHFLKKILIDSSNKILVCQVFRIECCDFVNFVKVYYKTFSNCFKSWLLCIINDRRANNELGMPALNCCLTQTTKKLTVLLKWFYQFKLNEDIYYIKCIKLSTVYVIFCRK